MTVDRRLAARLHLHAVAHDAFATEPVDRGDIVQVHTAADVEAGRYDGDVTVAELRRFGPLGIGTLEGLDGELVVVDGEFWDVGPDGVARPAPDDARVPFAVLTDLTGAEHHHLDGPLDRAGFEAAVRALLPDPDGCYALRVEGRFAPVRFRSVARQRPPYRPLAEVLRTDQHEFEVAELTGTMVGFCFPDDAAEVDFAGFHLHLLSADRTTGGHVFDFATDGCELTIGHPHAVHVELA